jgi:hypothetical protein
MFRVRGYVQFQISQTFQRRREGKILRGRIATARTPLRSETGDC